MMSALGWTPGRGLGPTLSGRPSIVEAGTGNKNYEGLGLRPNRGKRIKKDSIKAALAGDSVMFVKEHANTYERLEITTRGKAKLTGKLISLSPHELRDPMWWGSGLASQIEESFYPNPKDWTLGNIYKPLNLITVRDLTWSFTERISSDPTSKAKWENILGGIDWRTLLSRYKPGLATPKDFGSHLKNILHRALRTNPHNPQASTHKCRLCGEERESILHLGTCEWLRPVFEVMRKFDKGSRWDEGISLA